MPETAYTADEMMTVASARMIRNGMQRDFSWEHQVRRYVELYRRLTELNAA